MLCSSIVSLLVLMAVEASWALTEEEKTSIVDDHNKYRAAVSPPASDMLKMKWDSALADMATEYAKTCNWAHNPNRGPIGENLYAMSGPTVDVHKAVGDWNNEKQYYNIANKNCVDGKDCGHYTQVVWAGSDKVGCGEQFCEKVQGLDQPKLTILVCNYAPPGNVVGEAPYTAGTSCSKCPSNYKCVSSLCESGVDGQTSEPNAVPGRQPNLIVLFAVFLFASLL